MSRTPAEPEHPHFGQPQRAFGGPGSNGLGLSRGHSRGLGDDAFASQADRGGAAAWAREQGWRSLDQADPRMDDAAQLVHSAPARRIDLDHHPRNVMAGRIGGTAALAFDIAVDASTGWIAEWAVTAIAIPDALPRIRWTPARLWSHNPYRLIQVPSGDEFFDARWRVLANADEPRLRRLAADPAIRQALLATDDGEDIWTADGYLAALRPDGHRPQLLTHHVGLLSTLRHSLINV